jgi:hypothetical protein
LGAQDTYCVGNIYRQTFMDSIPLAREKLIGYDETDGQSA